MISKDFDYFRCYGWECQGVASKDRLGFGTRLVHSAFDSHCQVEKPMRPCLVLMTTLLCLMRGNRSFGPVKFFITVKCSEKVISPILISCVLDANGFSNWLFAACVWKSRQSSIMKMLIGACCLIPSNSLRATVLKYAPESTRAFLLGHSRKPKHIQLFLSAFQDYTGEQWVTQLFGFFVCHQRFFDGRGCFWEREKFSSPVRSVLLCSSVSWGCRSDDRLSSWWKKLVRSQFDFLGRM